MKKFTKKQEVNRRIRKAFHEGLTTTDLSSVHAFVEEVFSEYDKTPETLAFFVQRINSFQLFKKFRDAGGKQVYPTIALVDVPSFCTKYGYPDIFKTIKENLIARKSVAPMSKKSSYNTQIDDYSSLKKAASKDTRIREALASDKDKQLFGKFAASKSIYALKDRTEEYWGLRGIESFIKMAKLDTHPGLKEILDTIRSSKIEGLNTKQATLGDFLNLKKNLYSFMKEARLSGIIS